jgi:predicted hydrocarbon binding protein
MSDITTARDALVLLSRIVYDKYGDESLPLITEAWYRLGLGTGEKRKRDLPSTDIGTASNAFWGSFEGVEIKATENDARVFSNNGKCLLGLENAGRVLCEAMMCLDKGLLEAVTGEQVEMKILRTVADGDDICDIVYSIKPPNSQP